MALITHTLYPEHIALTSRNESEWQTLNPVLLKGELGIESDTQRIKIGNGKTAWSDLSYIDSEMLAAVSDLTERVESLESLAGSIMEVVSSVMDNIMKGEINV
ncbi:MAG: hypothetical protein IJG34_10215 [Synergistaceae bacterium]|nr:hypothetical protein [Synergistaceae bacterium]MBQ3450255.1 hypothetical protein [Synergistaceae bacterium]MBQ3694356.1 hypothetical protein [Synergistaceae bacterium]MBQ9629091.1 hypothetical protein [Synergistaceae bacterium]MBR0251222.1 hypothetical protein [Synergistaceae bacterium]